MQQVTTGAKLLNWIVKDKYDKSKSLSDVIDWFSVAQ